MAQTRLLPKLFQGLVLAVGLGGVVYAVALRLGASQALALWLWPGMTTKTSVWIAAMVAGGAMPLIWAALNGQMSALRAAMLSGFVANGGIALYLAMLDAGSGRLQYLGYEVVFGLGAAFSTAGFIVADRTKDEGQVDEPAAIRWVFLAFAMLLGITGLGLLLHLPVYPATLSANGEVYYGWFFLGSFAYYLYAVVRPRGLDPVGHLLSFLVYDAMLAPPLLLNWSYTAPQYHVQTYVYLVVLVGSAIFCTYYLFVDARTRLAGARQATPAAAK